MADSGSTGDEAVHDATNEVETGGLCEEHHHNGADPNLMHKMHNFIEPTGEEINPNAVIDSFEQNSFEQSQLQPNPDMSMFASQVFIRILVIIN